TFAKTKVTRASARKLLIFCLCFSSFASTGRPVMRCLRKAEEQDQQRFARWAREPPFFACAKKPGAKKHTPPPRPALRAGSAEPAGFSEGASCPCGKRRTSLCGAPAGSDPPAPPLRRG